MQIKAFITTVHLGWNCCAELHAVWQWHAYLLNHVYLYQIEASECLFPPTPYCSLPCTCMSAFSGPEPEPHQNDLELISAFHIHYYQFEQAVHGATAVLADSNVLACLGDDLDEYSNLARYVLLYCYILLRFSLVYFSMQLFLILQSLPYFRQIL